MGTLFVIGNGFDLAHRLPVALENFWTIFNNSNIETPTGKIIKGDEFRQDYAETWCEWEKGLNEIDVMSFYEEYQEGPDYLSDREDDRQGIVDRAASSAQGIISAIRGALEDMVDRANEQLSATGPLWKASPFGEDDYIVTFNYTDTLERIYHAPSQIFHVHGRWSVREQLVFGYHDVQDAEAPPVPMVKQPPADEFEDWWLYDGDPLMDAARREFQESIRYLRKEYRLAALGKFLDGAHVDRVVVLGHSMAEVDEEYFRLLIRLCRPSVWWISEHDNDPNTDDVVRRFQLDPDHIERGSIEDFR